MRIPTRRMAWKSLYEEPVIQMGVVSALDDSWGIVRVQSSLDIAG